MCTLFYSQLICSIRAVHKIFLWAANCFVWLHIAISVTRRQSPSRSRGRGAMGVSQSLVPCPFQKGYPVSGPMSLWGMRGYFNLGQGYIPWLGLGYPPPPPSMPGQDTTRAVRLLRLRRRTIMFMHEIDRYKCMSVWLRFTHLAVVWSSDHNTRVQEPCTGSATHTRYPEVWVRTLWWYLNPNHVKIFFIFLHILLH